MQCLQVNGEHFRVTLFLSCMATFTADMVDLLLNLAFDFHRRSPYSFEIFEQSNANSVNTFTHAHQSVQN